MKALAMLKVMLPGCDTAKVMAMNCPTDRATLFEYFLCWVNSSVGLVDVA